MEKKSFVLHTSYIKQISLLSKEDAGALFVALLEYAESGKPAQLEGMANLAFSFIAEQIDRDKVAYIKRCEKNRENGQKGGRPKKDESDSPKNPENRTVFRKSEKSLYDNDNDCENDDENISPPKPPSKGGGKKEPDPFVEFAGDDDEMKDALDGYVEMRKKIRKPMTDRAKRTFLGQLTKLSADRREQVALIDTAIAKNWLSVYPDNSPNIGQNRMPQASYPRGQPQPTTADFDALIARLGETGGTQ